jgi:hypothetical protein
MAYQILKGWPCEGAIDPSIAQATAGAVTEGTCGMVDDDGNAAVGNYATAGTDATLIPFFCIGIDPINGNALALMGSYLIKVDSTHYAAASYEAGTPVSFTAGKFSTVDTSQPAVGTVLSYDATAGSLVVLMG